MKKLVNILLAATISGAALTARAEEPAKTPASAPVGAVAANDSKKKPSPFTLTGDVTFRSIYNANGGTFFSEGPVLQHSTTGCYKTLCLTVWGNHDSDMKKYNETDVTLEYARDLWGKGTLKAGIMELALFPREGNQNSTQEAFLSYTPPNGPEVRFCKHFNQSNGWVLKSSYSRQVGPAVGTLTVGHNHHYWTRDKDGGDGSGYFAELNVAFPVKINNVLTVSPSVSCQAATGTLESKCWGNLGLLYSIPLKKSDNAKK